MGQALPPAHSGGGAHRNRSPTNIGTELLTPYSAASSTSQPKPLSTSSLPETQPNNRALKSPRALSNAAIADSASGDRLPRSNDNTAPAPTQSSQQGRNESSSHRSPAGITATPRTVPPQTQPQPLHFEACSKGGNSRRSETDGAPVRRRKNQGATRRNGAHGRRRKRIPIVRSRDRS